MKDIQPEELKDIRIANYTYELPDSKIARYPLKDRSCSKLLIVDNGEIRETKFSGVTDLLSAGQTLVFNNTKVIYARIFFQKSTGAHIEVFCLEPVQPSDYVSNFASKGRCEWKCMVGNLKKWKEEKVYHSFNYQGEEIMLSASKVEHTVGGEVIIQFEWSTDLTFSEILECCGQIPIPPYLSRDSEESDKLRYQTIYSKYEGSVAAPTAGLHFTEEIIEACKNKGVFVEELTLHVGAGTFKPVKAASLGAHEMHTEYITVPRELIIHLLENTGERIAVGTTSVRTLESLYWMGVKLLEHQPDFNSLAQWEVYSLPGHYSLLESLEALKTQLEQEGKEALEARTTILIVPGYRFRVVDAFFTNFHQPDSTLLLLVASAIGEDWKRVYQYALEHDFRFLSYGDSSYLRVVKNQTYKIIRP